MQYMSSCVFCCLLLLLSSCCVDAYELVHRSDENSGFGFFEIEQEEESKAAVAEVDPFKHVDVKAVVHETPKSSAKGKHKEEDVDKEIFKTEEAMVDAEKLSEEEAIKEPKMEKSAKGLSGVKGWKPEIQTEEESETHVKKEAWPFWMDISSPSGPLNIPGVTQEQTEETERDEESTVDPQAGVKKGSKAEEGDQKQFEKKLYSTIKKSSETASVESEPGDHEEEPAIKFSDFVASIRHSLPGARPKKHKVIAQPAPKEETTEPSKSKEETKRSRPVVKTTPIVHQTEEAVFETAHSLEEEHATLGTSHETTHLSAPKGLEIRTAEMIRTAESEAAKQFPFRPQEEVQAPSSRTTITSMDALIAHLQKEGVDTSQLQTDVELSEGKVGLLIGEGTSLRLEHLTLDIEDVDILVKLLGGQLDLLDVSIIHSSDSNGPRRSLKQRSQLKTGLDIEGGATVSAQDSTFESATETMIKVHDGSIFECNGCVFRNNEGIEGGAVSVKDSTAHFVECTMIRNAADNGGAIHFEDSSCSFGPDASSLTLANVHFEDNRAARSGASVFLSCAKDIHISGSSFVGGFANDGGAVYFEHIQTLQIEGSDFTHNNAETSGGGLYVDSAEVVSVIRSSFKNNAALQSNGGAGYITKSADITFRHSTFNKNHAIEGGALTVVESTESSGKLFLQRNQFQENNAAHRGGAVLLQRVNTTAVDASDDSTIDNVYVSVANSGFSGNSAGRGGAIFASSEAKIEYNLKIVVQGTNFTHNGAEKVGGGVYCGDNAIIDVSYSVFDGNSASQGTNCAMECGCRLTLTNSHQVPTDDADPAIPVQDLCAASDRTSGRSSNDKTAGAIIYVFIALGVMCGFFAMGVAVVFKKRKVLNEQYENRLSHRSLSHVVGPDRTTSIMSVSFLPADGYDDDEQSGGPTLLRSQTYGEMDYYVNEGNEDHAESLDHDMVANQEEGATLQQTLSADHAFFDALKWEDNMAAPSIPRRLTSIPELESHPTSDD